ncbi:unnamed protein product [Clonostachys chloroleuca]|uniref:Uncharacterized protein n=1 Tax=Clonostachys chloroleuca TaxID=1926264 RepID=A0AA35LZV2_9HYPO|nr:unnamed protein product [Clonostachys chloroleuca]
MNGSQYRLPITSRFTYLTPETDDGPCLDIYIDKWEIKYCYATSSEAGKLPYMVIKDRAIQLSSSIDANEMDDEEEMVDEEDMDYEEDMDDKEEMDYHGVRAIQVSYLIDAGTLDEDGEVDVSAIDLEVGVEARSSPSRPTSA